MKIKKVIAMIMALAVIDGVGGTNAAYIKSASFAYAADEETTAQTDSETISENGLIYKINGDTAEIVGYEDGIASEIVIPEKVSDISITSIAKRAFEGCDTITSVTIPDTITTIGAGAFRKCGSLTSATFSYEIMHFTGECPEDWEGIFVLCPSFEEVTYSAINKGGGDDGVHRFYLWSFLFQADQLTDEEKEGISTDVYKAVKGPMYLPLTFKKINVTEGIVEKDEFYNFKTVEVISFSDAVNTIPSNAFIYCSAIKHLELPSSFDTNPKTMVIGGIKYEYFDDHAEIIGYTDDLDEELVISDEATKYVFENSYYDHNQNAVMIFSYVHGNSFISFLPVTAIRKGAFQNCDKLKSVVIPDSVTYIGDSAFKGCSNLTKIQLPEQLEYMGEKVFYRSGIAEDEIPTAEVYLAGDANLDKNVDLADAVRIMQSVSNPDKYSMGTVAAKNADVSGNGDGVTNKDALTIQKYMLSLIKELPKQ